MNNRNRLKTPPLKFDPFSDRRSRDIRNQLSESFVRSINVMDSTHFDRTARDIVADHPAKIYHDYIVDRLKIYQHAYDQIQSGGFTDARQQVPILWNIGLFFEVHELLEDLWQPAKGDLKKALKGLIQAAGVYVHLQQGNQKAAKGLAKRALSHLEQAGDCLIFIDGIADLAQKLHHLDDIPPNLTMVKDNENKIRKKTA